MVTLAALLLALPAPPMDGATVVIDGRRVELEEVSSSLGPEVARVAGRWSEVADRLEADVHLTEDGRVLLLTHSSGARAKKEMKLVGETLALVDELLPARPAATDAGKGSASSRMPAPKDEDTLVLLQPADQKEYVAVLAEVVEGVPYLEAWHGTAKSLPGFTLSQPLVAAWIESLDGQEEFDVRNELVHRLAHLAIARRFGELPYWLQTGLSWHVEEEVLGTIYCFPYRDAFVWATEHSSWDKDLARAFKTEKTGAFFTDLCAWRRGTYRADEARQAFGLARFLVTHHREAAPQVLADLFHLRATEGVKSRPGGGWDLIPGWEPDAAGQRAVFERVLGPEALEQAARYFALGKRYKAPKPSR